MRAAARARPTSVQLREKDLEERALLELARAVVAAVAGTPARVLVNRRPDMRADGGAHGVQLPTAGLPVAAVLRAFPPLLVGASCHSPEEARAAAEAGALDRGVRARLREPGRGVARAGRRGPRGRRARRAGPGLRDRRRGRRHRTAGVVAGAAGVAAIRPFLEGDAGDAVRALRAGLS